MGLVYSTVYSTTAAPQPIALSTLPVTGAKVGEENRQPADRRICIEGWGEGNGGRWTNLKTRKREEDAASWRHRGDVEDGEPARRGRTERRAREEDEAEPRRRQDDTEDGEVAVGRRHVREEDEAAAYRHECGGFIGGWRHARERRGPDGAMPCACLRL